MVARARRDRQSLPAQPQHHRSFRRRPIGEIDPNRRRHVFDVAGRPQVQLHDQIRAVRERPGDFLRQHRPNLSRGPAEEVAIRKVGGPQNQAFVAGLGVGLVQLARGSGRIDPNVRVVNGAAAGSELDAAHMAWAGERDGDDEVAEDVRAVGAQAVRWQLHDHVRTRPVLSARGPGDRGAGRHVDRGPGTGPFDYPCLVGVGQAAFAVELAVARLRLPRRHVAAADNRGNRRGTRADVARGGQAEWAVTVVAMAGRAVTRDERGDVACEAEGGGSLGRSRRGGQVQGERQTQGRTGHLR